MTEHIAGTPVEGATRLPQPQGLTQKFVVRRTDPDAQARHRDCRTFVLEPRHDPHARAALQAYIDSCMLTEPQLAHDLANWLAIEEMAARAREQDGRA